jgi:hypothetical protein
MLNTCSKAQEMASVVRNALAQGSVINDEYKNINA